MKAIIPLLLLTAVSAEPQTRSFAAAAIHPNRSGGVNTQISTSGGRLVITNASLKTLVRNAWDLLSFQIAGGPSWFDTEMFDITATTGSAAEISSEDFRLLLRSLLDERFHLRSHFESRNGAVYTLLADKTGVKLKTGEPGAAPGINTSKTAAAARMKGTNEPVAILTSNLANQLGRCVEDRTGLDGGWNWVLEWAPDPSPDSTLPSLFTAVRQQLGLRLEPAKGKIPVLVVDQVQQPSEN